VAWADLLALLEQRNRDRAAAGLPPQEPTAEELGQLMARLPAMPDPKSLELPEDTNLSPSPARSGGPAVAAGAPDRGPPPFAALGDNLNGLVVNRSTGGLGILPTTKSRTARPWQRPRRRGPRLRAANPGRSST